MENGDISSLLDTITKSERVGILLGSESEDTDVLAAHALKERLNDRAHIMNMPSAVQKRWANLFPEKGIKKEVALSFNIEENPIGELRYEKQNGHLRIFLSPDHPITKESFDLEEHYPACDAIVAFGFADEKDLSNTLTHDAPFKNERVILNLSRSHIKHTYTSPPAVDVKEKALFPWNEAHMKLLGRALLRSHTDEDIDVLWAFLPKEDFEKTETKPSILPSLVEHMSTIITLPSMAIVLWQEEMKTKQQDHIKVLIYGSDREMLRIISLEAKTPLTNGYLILESYTTFSEAEIEIRKLLKNVL
ncbi:MAG: hypothetical protein COU90_03965 [Candidatus Ryanbacteria bacterium CG10_big_fil_rev_8_21_14_0_10_43_42]|uniref:Uncharacterized protein n=1 Tax=Candidatus Ryanbacteria bacterium CG10_big_fil_rev_8_21_14_0_10_43_42 TaxID=1974864 RepID=A0A2M8KWD6_9BACT|nr:MAG: hypothetical protein COU90_03965 [Candidatus Ryanbacteria bacterium CG10_big_fil_rev_8_21_14_0_10_43_42]